MFLRSYVLNYVYALGLYSGYALRSLPLTMPSCTSLHVTLPLIPIACRHIEGVSKGKDNMRYINFGHNLNQNTILLPPILSKLAYLKQVDNFFHIKNMLFPHDIIECNIRIRLLKISFSYVCK